ncbi:MAG TPA: hypothetical protein VD838_10580, partial [Anaeromyxobacteraceae bacterium]|nr:hypothetical protein [Anaeromyxobacteraceae bacterium]
IGAVALVLGVVAMLLDGEPADDPSPSTRLALLASLFSMPVVMWLLLVAILGSLTVRVKDDAVEQVLWRRFVVRRRPLASLRKVTGGSFAALVLHFAGRAKIAVPGMHAQDAHAFLVYLDALRPDLGLLDRE